LLLRIDITHWRGADTGCEIWEQIVLRRIREPR